MNQSFRAVTRYETKKEKQHRIDAQNSYKESRSERRARFHKGEAQNDVQLANLYQSLGIPYTGDFHDCFKQIPKLWEGRKYSDVRNLPEETREFLKANFNCVVKNKENLYLSTIHFVNSQEESMKLTSEIAEKCGHPRKVVKEVLDSLVTQIHDSLARDRGIRLPEIGKISVKFRPAKPKRKGRNPFNGKEMTFKAKPASNKLRFSPAKSLKEFALKKIKVVAPHGKKKKAA